MEKRTIGIKVVELQGLINANVVVLSAAEKFEDKMKIAETLRNLDARSEDVRRAQASYEMETYPQAPLPVEIEVDALVYNADFIKKYNDKINGGAFYVLFYHGLIKEPGDEGSPAP